MYYVGRSTEDNLGTYMMLENSAAPFIIDIAGLLSQFSELERTSGGKTRLHIAHWSLNVSAKISEWY